MSSFKRFLSLFIVFIMLTATFVSSAEADGLNYDKKTEAFSIRDPFVLCHEGKYYMYGTGAAKGRGYGCYVSEDLENWAGPFNVFTAPDGFDGTKNFWAPECHFYKGNFYLFATYFSASTQKRGTSVFKADNPLGPFEEISDGHITPHDKDSIDGTIYVDESGQPWMVYVEEWTSAPDGIGSMAAAKLSEDLSEFVSEPKTLFYSNAPAWTDSGVTDGPFLYKAEDGQLIMLWSSFKNGYLVGAARSLDGTVDGKWIQEPSPIYRKNIKQLDGGHGMIFKTNEGKLMMSLHSPNTGTQDNPTTAKFVELVDTGKTVRIKEDFSSIGNFFFELAYDIILLWNRITDWFCSK